MLLPSHMEVNRHWSLFAWRASLNEDMQMEHIEILGEYCELHHGCIVGFTDKKEKNWRMDT